MAVARLFGREVKLKMEQLVLENGELVFVQSEKVAITIKGSASHPVFSGVSFDEKEASLQIVCDDEYSVSLAGEAELIAVQNLRRAYLEKYRLKPLFFEQQRYEIIIEAEPGHKIEFWHDNYNIRKNVTPVGKRGNILSGILNFGNEIGMSDLEILVDGKRYMKITLEIFPSKISYKDDYKAIVTDVTAEVYNLVFDFLKKTYDSFDISSSRQSSPVEFFAVIRKIYGEFIAAADRVIARPHHVLEKEYEVLPRHKIKRIDSKTIRWIERHPDQAVRSSRGVLVDRALAVKKYVTYDTKENRLTKYMLQITAKKLEEFQKQYMKLSRDTDPVITDQISSMVNDIKRRYNTGFFNEVKAFPANSGMSLVFGLAPGYRELYRCYLMLQHGLSITGGIFDVSVKDLAVLYEYWCFIKLNSLMKNRYKLLFQDIIKIAGNGLFVSLVKGQRSRVRYLNPDNGEIITLTYNPKEINVPTVTQKPDNVLRLEKKGADTDYEYIFDAKYRINAALDGSMYEKMYQNPGPQEDDINTMHRYRDAIVYQNNASPYERTMFGAYVLFPYHNEKEYMQHRFYKSIEQVNIGGLPFLPTATGLVSQLLDELISDSPESAFERAALPAGIEERLAKVDWDKREVMIGFVDSDDQMQRCLQYHCYYTYKQNVSRQNLPIYYVAMYRREYGIEYYGKVLKTQERRRSELPGNARWKDRLCYCFDVDEWVRLPDAIRPELYGPHPIAYTNYFLLTHSRTYPELHFRNEAEYRFFTELKRRSDKAIVEEGTEKAGFELDSTRVLFEGNSILIFRDGRQVADCTIAEFTRHPNATFQRLQNYMEEISEAAAVEEEA